MDYIMGQMTPTLNINKEMQYDIIKQKDSMFY